jgi:hypothetical protein
MKFIEYNVRVYENGNKNWYNEKGQYHREDGPAIEYANGYKVWYKGGRCHRVDGPAVEHITGDKDYYLDGVKHSEEEFLAKTSVKEQVSYAGKVLEFEGKIYRLEEVKD